MQVGENNDINMTTPWWEGMAELAEDGVVRATIEEEELTAGVAVENRFSLANAQYPELWWGGSEKG